MKKLFYGLILSLSILTSCEKEEDLGNFDAINVSSITNSSAYICGDAKVESKMKGLIISEQSNVSEANGTAYYDEKSVGKKFVFTISGLYANTKYYFKVFYTDPSGGKVYSSEKTFTTTNIVMATIFESLVDKDTVLNGKPISQVGFMLKETGGIRNAEYGICYSKSSAPAVTDTKIAGNIGSNGLILCNTSSMNFYDTVTVRPYCKSDKGIDYGVATKYVRPSWINCGLFPGETTNDPGAISHMGKGYVFLGSNLNTGKGANTDLWCFDPQTFLWTKEVALDKISEDAFNNGGNGNITNMKAVPFSDGFIFFKGYSDIGIWHDKFYTYDISNKQYSQLLTKGIPDEIRNKALGYNGFFVNGQTYITLDLGDNTFWGYSKGTFIYRYNNTNKTFELETVNADRQGERVSVYFSNDNLIFIGGGAFFTGVDRLATDFWSYNLSTKIWTRLNDVPISKFKYSFVYKNRCFAIGYDDRKLYEYIVGSDSWRVVEKLPYYVEAVMPFDEGLYIFTTHVDGKKAGSSSDKYVNRVWRSAVL